MKDGASLDDLSWVDPGPRPEFAHAMARLGGLAPSSVNAFVPDPIAERSDPIPLRGGPEITVGSRASCTRSLPHISPVHFVVARQPQSDDYWVADNSGRTFVNRRAVSVQRLTSGDLLQAGPYAWTFSAADGFLVPAGRIDGVRLTVRGLRGRVEVTELDVLPGQFVAIVGASAAGKSSLLKAIARLPGFNVGQVLADGWDVDRHPERYRALLGYLSQDAFVHSELTPMAALEFIARLRRGSGSAIAVEEYLRELEIREDSWYRPLASLSGGEQKRVRVASELLAAPRLLLLDEPASGLDRGREGNLMRLLRSLSQRGSTVLVVTHGLGFLEFCDRVLVVESGKLQGDGAAAPAPMEPPPVASPGADVPAVGAFEQFRVLLDRESALLWKDWPRRLAVPLLLLPVLFAVALHFALAGPAKLDMLGFFCVLSVIWMGSSLGLLSIAGEREVFEHEHFLYLRTGPYLFAKFTLLGALAVFQIAVFQGLLWLLRSSTPEGARFHSELLVGVVLLPVELGAIAQGLWLSAVAGRNRQVANLLLPLVMIAQIVFSAQVAGNGGSRLETAYQDFHLHRCAAWPDRRAIGWVPSEGGWLSEGARRAYRAEMDRGAEDILARLRDQAPAAAAEEPRVADPVAVALSYGLLSRYGDILLRSFAAVPRPHAAILARYDYGRWQIEAAAAVLVLTALFLALTTTTLWVQCHWAGQRRSAAFFDP